ERLRLSGRALELDDAAVARLRVHPDRQARRRTDRDALGDARAAARTERHGRRLAERLARRPAAAPVPAGPRLPARDVAERAGLLVFAHGRHGRLWRPVAVDSAVVA